MMLRILLCLIFMAIVNICHAEPGAIRIHAPSLATPGKPVILKVELNAALPASSFYRVDIKCPVKPANARISMKAGVPESELTFSAPGKYECELEAGYVTKSSCAGVSYTNLGTAQFGLDVLEK